MAKKQGSKIGYDPLGWMKGEAPPAGAPEQSAGSKGAKSGGNEPEATDPVKLIEDSFAALAPQGELIVRKFYERLFRKYPQVKPLFGNADVKKQQKKLLSALVLVVNNIRKPAELSRALRAMGLRHQQYGAEPEHYGAVKENLLAVLAEVAGELWTDELAAAWSGALDTVAAQMLEAYSNTETNEMATSKKAMEDMLTGETTVVDDLEVVQNILEYAPMNIMMANADEEIVFVNKKAVDTLTRLESELAKYLPGFRVAEVVGGSIHRYHKDPGKIARLLQNLHPGETRKGEITPGDFVFEHETRALYNSQGDRVGYVVQWQDATETRQKEDHVARLQGAIDGAMTAIMMIDRDLVITYANKSTVDLLSLHEDKLRSLYRGFTVDGLIGTCIDIFHANPAHQRRLLDDPRNLPYSTDIQVGPLVFRINVTAMYDVNNNYIGNTLEWSEVTETRKKEKEVAQLTSAIDGAQTNLMLCDADLHITYANPSVVAMMSKRQHVLREIFPGFDASKLIGRNIDMFHKNPAHQRQLLADKTRLPAKAEMKVADLEFEVNATMIIGPDGEYMGNMVEWKDITEQKDAERQIQNMIESAAAGDLGNRIDVSRYDGFLKGLGGNINQLMDAIARPMEESVDVMKALSEGHLTKTMQGDYEGAFRELSDAVNGSITNLQDMVGKINEASSSIATGASEISEGNTNLSQRTEEQASSLEETASSMEQLTSTVKQNADNARQANQLSNAARQTAETGGDVVGKAIHAMGEINASSKKIADIISVIDEIAFQTNLLALNAAVEAARAGEQGRGFAVVAGEVRNLAQRSATAAKEIKDLINDSVEKVKEGSALVDESGRTLSEIVAGVKKVSDIISEIAAASAEQSSGIEQVNKAVMQMDEMTQQNAALVEEAAAASKSMDDQARMMTDLMTFFKVDESMAMANKAPRKAGSAPARPSAPAQSARPKPASRPAPRPAAGGDDDDWSEF